MSRRKHITDGKRTAVPAAAGSSETTEARRKWHVFKGGKSSTANPELLFRGEGETKTKFSGTDKYVNQGLNLPLADLPSNNGQREVFKQKGRDQRTPGASGRKTEWEEPEMCVLSTPTGGYESPLMGRGWKALNGGEGPVGQVVPACASDTPAAAR